MRTAAPMVTLQSRWKRNRSWNVRLYIGLVVSAVLCVVLVFVVKGVIVWVKDVVVPAAIPKVVSSPEEHDPAAEYRGDMIGEFDREFRVGGYTFVLPKDFELDVLPQPSDTPRGGRFTGVRLRVARDDAAQLFVVVIDYPENADEETDDQARATAALERLFARLTRNAAMIRLDRGDTEFGDLEEDMPFARCKFSGDVRNGRRAARVRCVGAALAAVEERRDIFMYSLCDNTVHRDDRELLEASLLSLRRAGTPREAETDEAQAGEAP